MVQCFSNSLRAMSNISGFITVLVIRNNLKLRLHAHARLRHICFLLYLNKVTNRTLEGKKLDRFFWRWYRKGFVLIIVFLEILIIHRVFMSQNNLSTMLPHCSLFYIIFVRVLDQYKLAMPL